MNTPRTQGTSPAAAPQPTLAPHLQDAAPFEHPCDPPVPDHELEGLTVEEALARLNGAVLASVYGHH